MKTSAITVFSVLLLAGAASAQTATTTVPTPVGTSGSSDAAAAGNTANDYRLVAGDKLRIEVYKDAQLSQSLQIRPDGKVTLPLVGDVTAAGRTSAELRDAIGARPVASRSPISGIVILPSGRTCSDCDSCASL